jgi:hypothetical protein
VVILPQVVLLVNQAALVVVILPQVVLLVNQAVVILPQVVLLVNQAALAVVMDSKTALVVVILAQAARHIVRVNKRLMSIQPIIY